MWCTLGALSAKATSHPYAHEHTMLAIFATSLATLELTPDTWEKALEGKSAMVK